MNNLQVFENDEFGSIRTLVIDGEPWLVGKDIASALGYKDTSDALKKHVEDEDKQLVRAGEMPTLKVSNYGAYLINESGLYSLILSSKLESAKKFKRWVTHEVLPTIRKTGMYANNRIISDENMTKIMCAYSRANRYQMHYMISIMEQNGYVFPPFIEQTPKENNSVIEFLGSYDVENRATSEVYTDYVRFCTENQMVPVSHITFSKEANKLAGTTTKVVKREGVSVRVFITEEIE